MKLVTTIIKPHMLDEVRDTLSRLGVAGMTVVFLVPALVILTLPVWGNFAALALALPAFALMAICYAPTLAYYRQSGATAVLLPIAAFLFTAMTLGSAYRHWRGEGAEWKARSYDDGG